MIVGIVLAAGKGRRFGSPKAFERGGAAQTWVERAIQSLIASGCHPVIVTLPELRDLAFEDSVLPLIVPSSLGQGASLDAALAAVPLEATAVVITLVDLPDVDSTVVRRVLDATQPIATSSLARAVFRGEPGHPVIIGRTHFEALRYSLGGDRGARDYLDACRPRLIECGDLASGLDVDERV